MKLLLIALLLSTTVTVAAVAAEDSDLNPEYKGFYLVGNNKVDLKAAEAAIMASIKGQEVYKCVTVKASLNKTGTAISMKNIKRKK